MKRANDGVCIFESGPHEEYYCTRAGFEPVFYLNPVRPCPDCANNKNNKNNKIDSGAHADGGTSSSPEKSTGSKPEAPEPSLRRCAILNSCLERMDKNVQWDPTVVVEDTLLHRLMNVDTMLDGAALWARLVVTLSEHVFRLSDKMHLMAIWQGQLKGKYPEGDLESIVHSLARERGPEDKDMVKIRVAFDAAPKPSGSEEEDDTF